MKVYKIKLENDYNEYFVVANSFNEAESKIKDQKKKEKESDKQNIFTDDGSLKPEVLRNTEDKPIVVKEITMLSDKILQ